MFASRYSSGGVKARLLTALQLSLVGSLVVLICYGSFLYTLNGYQHCRKEGSSALWCLTTSKWQSFKTFFLSDKETIAKPVH